MSGRAIMSSFDQRDAHVVLDGFGDVRRRGAG